MLVVLLALSVALQKEVPRLVGDVLGSTVRKTLGTTGQESLPDRRRLFVMHRSFTFGTECIRSKQTQLWLFFFFCCLSFLFFFFVLFCFVSGLEKQLGMVYESVGERLVLQGTRNSANCEETLSADVQNSQESNSSPSVVD